VDLLRTVTERVVPLAHIFGHVHEGYGTSSNASTLFVNASSCTAQYRAVYPAIVFDVALVDASAEEKASSILPIGRNGILRRLQSDPAHSRRRIELSLVESRLSLWGADQVRSWLEAQAAESSTREQTAAEPNSSSPTTSNPARVLVNNFRPLPASVCGRLQGLTGPDLLELLRCGTFEHLDKLLEGLPEMAPIRARIDVLLAIGQLRAQLF